MDLTQVSLFAGALVVLPALMMILSSAINVPVRMQLPVYFGLSLTWGIILYFSGQISFNPAAFVIQSIATAFGAAGVHQQLPTFVPATASLLPATATVGTSNGTPTNTGNGTSNGTPTSPVPPTSTT